MRASLILALGAVGGADRVQSLVGEGPLSEAEALALAKVRDRAGQDGKPGADWRAGLALGDVYLETPVGLERPVSRMLVKEGFPTSVVAGEQLIRLTQPIALSRLAPLPREVAGLRLALSQLETPALDDAAIDQLVAQGAGRPEFAIWFEAIGTLRFRFSAEGVSPPRAQTLDWLARVRAGFEPLGMADSPSNYNCELIVAWSAPHATLFFRPRLERDARFDYRKASVPAAINPVVAAALVRLVNAGAPGVVVDPTCGGGTLLIERGLFDPGAQLVGLDIDGKAIAAARENAAAAGLGERARFANADCRDPANWPACTLVVANLPFGIRSGRRDSDLLGLYRAILSNAAAKLEPGGRIVLASANRRALEGAVAAEKRRVTTLAKHHYVSGGLMVQVVVLGLR